MDREVPLPAMKTRSMSFPKSMDAPSPAQKELAAENTPNVVVYDWCKLADQEEHMYPVISFDEASRCWTRNKTKLTHGTYKYNT